MQWIPSFEGTMCTTMFERLLLDKFCLASEKEASSTISVVSRGQLLAHSVREAGYTRLQSLHCCVEEMTHGFDGHPRIVNYLGMICAGIKVWVRFLQIILL